MAHYKGAASEAGRAMHLMKKREKAQQEIELRKKKIEEDLKIENIENKFATHYDAVEAQLKSSTIGLVTLDEMKAKQEHIILKKIKKNPDVDTSFLPDREREEADLKLREELRLEWVMTQASLKDEPITVTFSFWDGSGHRRNVTLKKGNSIYQFLQRCLDTLRPEFSELKTVSADQLMYVKEDLILPHHYTFYDFIVTKARGKSGPLFQFDAAEDVRLVNDATQEKQDSHAGKVLLRSWYERNKHIFPASRWEPYDPTKTYSKYTTKGK
ncbi:XAP5, circadian clock regulator domain-containing protein [Phthorimaea operculella]|nr:XAP5, circadian clock regulator domain-containing protein [Phthorimaea operculella]